MIGYIFLEAVLYFPNSAPFSLHLFSAVYHPLCHCQSQIDGCVFSKDSVLISGNLFQTHTSSHLVERLVDTPGLPSVINSITANIREIWKFRNLRFHGLGNAAHEARLSKQTIESVTKLYDPKNLIFEHHFQPPQSCLCTWLASHAYLSLIATMKLWISTSLTLTLLYLALMRTYAPLPSGLQC